jgi:hypothetical protein
MSLRADAPEEESKEMRPAPILKLNKLASLPEEDNDL